MPFDRFKITQMKSSIFTNCVDLLFFFILIENAQNKTKINERINNNYPKLYIYKQTNTQIYMS